ncbi:MAG: patatin-like phospholipase family protein, partial [Thiohalocapsa sp.]|nr:patatin-like phospholipase family protein [Thiohalocapsa sp.]
MTLAESLGIRPRPYRILTLDGGGIRGIIPVVWLERLERHLAGPVHGHFDLIAGTSVGAILGCAF